MRGEAFYFLGKYKEAIEDLKIAITYLQGTGYTHLLKAKAEWKLGMIRQACEDYSIALKGNPEYASEKEFINCH